MRALPLRMSLIAWILVASPVLGEGNVYPNPESVQPLAPGSQVPSAQVWSVDEVGHDLAEIVKDQGALLVFYRGGW